MKEAESDVSNAKTGKTIEDGGEDSPVTKIGSKAVGSDAAQAAQRSMKLYLVSRRLLVLHHVRPSRNPKRQPRTRQRQFRKLSLDLITSRVSISVLMVPSRHLRINSAMMDSTEKPTGVQGLNARLYDVLLLA